ncbi:MAG: hypothetical protein AAF806_09210 [Bacteroidota bacterium]
MRIQAIEHKGEKRIRLDFERDEKIISKIKQIRECKWSQSKRCWHFLYTKVAFEELKAMFGEELVLPEAVSKTKQPSIVDSRKVRNGC